MSIVLLAALMTARAESCSEDADQCTQIGNATVERAGELLYIECTSTCAVGVRGDRINNITVTEGSAALTLDHNILEVVIVGSDGSDMLDASGSPVPAEIDGGAGPDTILGSHHEDTLRGGFGNDTIDGLDGVDRIRGGRGNDTLIGGQGLDTLVGGRGIDRCHGDLDTRQCEDEEA